MIRIVCNAEEKRRIARSILEALTDWFGISEARETYICESADEIMVASFDNDTPNGFLCLKETGKDTVELAVMGVLKEIICANYKRCKTKQIQTPWMLASMGVFICVCFIARQNIPEAHRGLQFQRCPCRFS